MLDTGKLGIEDKVMETPGLKDQVMKTPGLKDQVRKTQSLKDQVRKTPSVTPIIFQSLLPPSLVCHPSYRRRIIGLGY